MRKNQVILNCKQCKKDYSVRFCLRDKSLFCSNSCKGLNMKETRVGSNNANYKGGKSTCTECKKLLSSRSAKPKKCWNCWKKGKSESKTGQVYPLCVNCSAKTGDIYSVLCRNCYRGILHPAWKGGVSPLYSLVRNMPENRQWVKQCMLRDGFFCRECNSKSTGNNLQVHHIKQFAIILKENKIDSLEKARQCNELWDMDNGITLCRDCHKLTENFNKKLS